MNTRPATYSVDAHALQRIMSSHLPIYSKKIPAYQTAMLESIFALWVGHPNRLLDVGGGTGVIAQAISELFPVEEVHAIDVVDRFCSSLNIATSRYDGRSLPFGEASFDAATLNNVLHHVSLEGRLDLLREIRRVVNGPLYIKDHESRGVIDDARLMAMDVIGNIPFGGMVRARYLSSADWERLAQESGYHIGGRVTSAAYRRGLYSWLFPNRLEVTMRFDPA